MPMVFGRLEKLPSCVPQNSRDPKQNKFTTFKDLGNAP